MESVIVCIVKLFFHQVMKKAHQYLASKHKVSSSEHAFKIKLYELWFKVSCTYKVCFKNAELITGLYVVLL